MTVEIKHRFTGKVIKTVDADNLSYSNLYNADLSGANLSGANLSGADLSGANLRETCVLNLGQRSDGYNFYAQEKSDGLWILAGCRCFHIDAAKKHWETTRKGQNLGAESLLFLEHAIALAKIRASK